MSSVIQKNEPVATKRRVRLNVFDPSTGLGADRGTDLTGYVYIGQSTYKFIPATGTLTNMRQTLVVADDVVEAVAGNTTTLTAHGYQTGDGPFTSDEVIGTIAIGDDIYIIVDDANTIAYAPTLADAYADNRETLTGTETGATISDSADTERGLDGKWEYIFTQPETNIVGCELEVEIIGHSTLQGGASVNMASEASSVWDIEAASGHPYGDLLRGIAYILLAKFSKVGNDYVWRNLDDTKDAITGTVTASGKIAAAIVDLTP